MKHKNQSKNHPEAPMPEEEALLQTEKDAVDETPAEDSSEAAESKALPRGFEEDVALFHDLFPDVKADDIPQEVWDRVESGESLAAAFSLYRMQQQKEEERIAKVNRENEEKAPPKIRHDGKEFTYFSPEAVKAMTQSEIKKNYDAILASMEKWN